MFKFPKWVQFSGWEHKSTTNLLSAFFFSWLRTNLMRRIQKSHWFCLIRSSFWAMSFFTFLFTCTHVWSILEEVGGGKIQCQIIVLIGNDYFNDEKYSGPIVIISKRDQFEVIKPRNLPKIGAAKLVDQNKS